MTDRSLTTLALRISAVFMFMKIFDHFGAYFHSVYISSVIFVNNVQTPGIFNKFYASGIILILVNIILSCILFFKADWMAIKLVKEDSDIINKFKAEQIIKAILLSTGVIWFAETIYSLPELYSFIRSWILWLYNGDLIKPTGFPIGLYVIKIILAWQFVFRVNRITTFLMKRMNEDPAIENKDNQNGIKNEDHEGLLN